MKIVSDFKDYYDSTVLAFSADSKYPIFTRFEQYPPKNIQDQLFKAFSAPHRICNFYSLSTKTSSTDIVYLPDIFKNVFLKTRTILFCGKSYHLIEVVSHDGCLRNCFYDASTTVDYLNSLFDNDLSVKKKYHSFSKKQYHSFSIEKQIEKYFLTTGQDSILRDWLINIKLSIALFKEKEFEMIINPNLEMYQFFKIFDTYQAFQELEMWIEGTLANPPNFMVEISDTDKIKKYGFDSVHGFRKRPNIKM